MASERISLKAIGPIGLGFMLLVAVGCGEESSMGQLTGTVTVDGQAVEGGSIAFFPTDGKSQTAGGMIRLGDYSVQVPFGSAKVEIRVPQIMGKQKMYNTPDSDEQPIVRETLPAKYNDRTELLVDIQPGTNREDFSLSTKKEK